MAACAGFATSVPVYAATFLVGRTMQSVVNVSKLSSARTVRGISTLDATRRSTGRDPAELVMLAYEAGVVAPGRT